MDLEHTIQGSWWLPETPEHRVHGELSGEPNGPLTLQVFGDLYPTVEWDGQGREFDALTEFTHEPIIYGLGVDGRGLTLLRCNGSRSLLPMTMQRSGWQVSAAIDGLALDGPEPRASRIRFEIDGLREWARVTLPREQRDLAVLGGDPALEILGEAPTALGTLRLRTSRRFSTSAWSASVEQVVSFELLSRDGVDVAEAVQQVVVPMKNLLGVLCARPSLVTAVRVFAPPESGDTFELEGRYYQRSLRPYDAIPAVDPHEILGPFPDLDVSFEDLVTRWLVLNETKRSAISMLLVDQRAPFLYSNIRMMTAFQSLEQYHEGTFESRSVTDEDHAERVARIVGAIPEGDDRDWVAQILRDKNMKGLKRKTEEVLINAGETGAFAMERVPGLAKEIVNARSAVAHTGSDDPDAGARFEFLSRALRWVMRHNLMLDLGVDPGIVNRLVTDHRQFRRDLRVVASLYAPAADTDT